jgi:hypothetical protein
VPTVNGDFKVFAAPGNPTSVNINDRTIADMRAEGANAFAAARGGASGGEPRKIKLYGAGNGQTVDMGEEDSTGRPQLDLTRAPVDVPGVGKAYYSKDGRGAYVMQNGVPVARVMLGYDDAASRQRKRQNLDHGERLERDIAHTDAQTARSWRAELPDHARWGCVQPEDRVRSPRKALQSGQTQRAMQKAAYTAGAEGARARRQSCRETTPKWSSRSNASRS